MLHARPRTSVRSLIDDFEGKAKALYIDDGFDPDQKVTHAYGDDFTGDEWESWWASNLAIPFQSVVNPMWRLYRARAAVETTDNVVPFRRRNV